jgi:hypothetical protein
MQGTRYFDIFKDTRYKIQIAEIHIRYKIQDTFIYLFIYLFVYSFTLGTIKKEYK